MWANETAFLGSWLVFIGAIVGIIGGVVEKFDYWMGVGIYGVAAGLFLIVLEYPRGKKTKGNTVTRSHHEIFTKINFQCYPLTSNYYIRAGLLFLMGVPAGIIVPTFFGGFCLLSASVIYLVAAIKNEKWEPVGINVTGRAPGRDPSISSPPDKPPPRLPQNAKAATHFTTLPQ